VQLQSAQDQLAYTKITAPIDGVVIVRSVEPGEVVTAGVTATVNGAVPTPAAAALSWFAGGVRV
jgi:multidrug resistance efflux pump